MGVPAPVTHQFKFGDYVRIEQKRYGAENELYLYRVVSTDMSSNCYRPVPFDARNPEHKMGKVQPVLLVANAALTSRTTPLEYVRPCDVVAVDR